MAMALETFFLRAFDIILNLKSRVPLCLRPKNHERDKAPELEASSNISMHGFAIVIYSAVAVPHVKKQTKSFIRCLPSIHHVNSSKYVRI